MLSANLLSLLIIPAAYLFKRYSYTSPAHLISRLTSRNMHLLALRISTFLSLKPDVVLKHWASAKISRSRPVATGTAKDAELDGDDEVCRLIVEKFKQLGGVNVSYAEIAKRAWEVGRTGLATKVEFQLCICLRTIVKYIPAARSRATCIGSGPFVALDEGGSSSATKGCRQR